MDFDHPPGDPVQELHRWLERAQREAGVPNPNAMTLATVDPAGQPSTRIVLLKHLDERGAVFFTNRSSRKGRELAVNPRVSLLLHWDRLDQQVRIEGIASPVGDEESDVYFASRPRGSRIGAWASEQSAPAPDRAAIEAQAREIEQRFAGVEIPRPPHWGGYRVSLGSIELWQGRADRLHDRVVYTATGNGWQVRRLWP